MRVQCPKCSHRFDHSEGRASKLTTRRKVEKAPKLPPRPRKPKVRSGGVPQDDAFLEFVRTEHACLGCNTRRNVESHHWGAHGVGQKCSDYETAPLCHECHVEKLHRTGQLNGKTAKQWLPRFRNWARRALERYPGPIKTANV